MSRDPIESAFPTNGNLETIPQDGMSLRDYLAGKAMQAMIGHPETSYINPDNFREIAQLAYVYADEMLKSR